MTFQPEQPDTEFDPVEAAALIGKSLLIGITYVNHANEAIEQEQMHGQIIRATKDEGIVIALEPSGEEFALPPALDAIYPAAPGEYRLRGSGEIVVDPDYTATFTVMRRVSH
jgi:hypothetical protein